MDFSLYLDLAERLGMVYEAEEAGSRSPTVLIIGELHYRVDIQREVFTLLNEIHAATEFPYFGFEGTPGDAATMRALEFNPGKFLNDDDYARVLMVAGLTAGKLFSGMHLDDVESSNIDDDPWLSRMSQLSLDRYRNGHWLASFPEESDVRAAAEAVLRRPSSASDARQQRLVTDVVLRERNIYMAETLAARMQKAEVRDAVVVCGLLHTPVSEQTAPVAVSRYLNSLGVSTITMAGPNLADWWERYLKKGGEELDMVPGADRLERHIYNLPEQS